MRTNIDIDDELMQQAMAVSGAPTKKAAVEEALRRMVQLKRQGEAIERLRGLAVWRGHDDDWFASDEEILAKREQAVATEETARAGGGVANGPSTVRQPA